MNPQTHRRRAVVLAAAAAVLVAACGSTTATTTAPPATTAPTTAAPSTTAPPATAPPGAVPSDNAGFRAQSTACGAAQPPENEANTYNSANDMRLDPNVKLQATITTSCGPIVVELDPAAAPETVNSFVFLATEGYFDGTVSHRVAPGFVIQAGDPTGTGRGGPGYIVPDEPPPADFLYSTGVLAMANAGPNTTGSQFFIMLADRALPPLYSVYGEVVDGFDTLEAIAAVPLGRSASGEMSVPLETVYIESIVVDGLD